MIINWDSAVPDTTVGGAHLIDVTPSYQVGSNFDYTRNFQIKDLEHPWSNVQYPGTVGYQIILTKIEGKNVGEEFQFDVRACNEDTNNHSIDNITEYIIYAVPSGKWTISAKVYYYTIAGNLHYRIIECATSTVIYNNTLAIEDVSVKDGFSFSLTPQDALNWKGYLMTFNSPYIFDGGFISCAHTCYCEIDGIPMYPAGIEYNYGSNSIVQQKNLFSQDEIDNFYGNHKVTNITFYYFDENGDYRKVILPDYDFTVTQQGGGTDPDTPGGGGGGSDPQPQPVPVVTSFKMRKVYLKNLIINSNKGGK